jgi:hypothetical protein
MRFANDDELPVLIAGEGVAVIAPFVVVRVTVLGELQTLANFRVKFAEFN